MKSISCSGSNVASGPPTVCMQIFAFFGIAPHETKNHIRYFLLMFIFRLSAGNENGFVRYSTDEGLPQNSVWNIFQDSNGFIWTATSNGLARFDGRQFVVYSHRADDVQSLSSNGFTQITESAGGVLWIGTDAGINRYDPATGKISRSYFSGKRSYHIPVVTDEQQQLWVWVNNTGFVLIDTRSGNTTRTITAKSLAPQLDSAYCLRVRSDGQGNCWILTDSAGLFCYNRHSGKTRQVVAGRVRSGFSMLRADGDSLLWVTMETPGANMLLLDQRTGTIRQRILLSDAEGKSAIATNCCRTSAGMCVATSAAGVFVLGRDEHTGQYITRENLLPGNACYSLLCDGGGLLWVGTDGNGLFKENGIQKKFTSYTNAFRQQNMVKTIFTSDSLVYSCLYNEGIDVFTRSGKWLRTLTPGADRPFRFTGAALREDDAHYWLLGENCFGLFDLRTETFLNLLPVVQRDVPGTSPVPHFACMVKNAAGELYAGFGDLLVKISRSGSGWKTTVLKKFTGDPVSALLLLPDGRLFAGTYQTLYSCDASLSHWEKHDNLISGTHVKSLCADASGRVWIGSIYGLLCFEPGAKTLKRFDERQGLPNNFIYGLLPDPEGNIWFSHNRGISKLDPEKQTFVHYNKENGLQSDEFNTGAFHRAADGHLFFGGVNGTNGFDASAIRPHPALPRVILSDARLFEEPLPGDTLPWARRHLQLAYDQNTLSFELAALLFTAPPRTRYAWRLEGLDAEWTEGGTRPYMRYANLAPGQYVLHARATNGDGLWGKPYVLLHITITPPFWQTTWFYLLTGFAALLLLACTGYYFFMQQRRRHARELRTQERIHSERERISRDLHDHVGAQLTLILSQIEWMRNNKGADVDAAANLEELSASAKQTIRKLRESIWAVQREAVPPDEFADKFKVYANELTAYRPALRLNFQEAFEGTGMLEPACVLHLSAACQEALNNALKHSGAATINILFSCNSAELFRFELSDDGTGFDQDTVQQGNGLNNMRHRAAESGARMELETSPGNGTTIRFIIKRKPAKK